MGFWLIGFASVGYLGIWLPLSLGNRWYARFAEHHHSNDLKSKIQQEQQRWQTLHHQTLQWRKQLERDAQLIKPQAFLVPLEQITESHVLQLMDLQIPETVSPESELHFSWQGPWQSVLAGLYELETLAYALRVTHLRLASQGQGMRAHVTLTFWRDDEESP